MNEFDWRQPTQQELSVLAPQIKPAHKIYIVCEIATPILVVVTFLTGDMGYSLTFIAFFFLLIASHIKDTKINKAMQAGNIRVVPCIVADFQTWLYFGNGASRIPKVKIMLQNGQIPNKMFVVDYSVYYAARGGVKIPGMLVNTGKSVKFYPLSTKFMLPQYKPQNPVKKLDNWYHANPQEQQLVLGYLNKQAPTKAKLGRVYKWIGLALGVFMALGFMGKMFETLPQGYLTFDVAYLILSIIGFAMYFILKRNQFNYKKVARKVSNSGCELTKVIVNTVYVKGSQSFAYVSDSSGNDLAKPIRVFPDCFSAYVASGRFYALLCKAGSQQFITLYKY